MNVLRRLMLGIAIVAMFVVCGGSFATSIAATSTPATSTQTTTQANTKTTQGKRRTKPIYKHPVFIEAVRRPMCGTPCTSTVCTSKGGHITGGGRCVYPTPAPTPTPTPTPASCVFNSITSPGTEALTGNVAPAGITGSFTDTCTNGHAYTIEFNAGLHGVDGTTPTRNISNGSSNIQYQIYRDGAHTQPWGDSAGTNTVAATGTGGAQGWTFYVQISTPPMTIPAGTYNDTVTATIAY